jgi:hypothetical protein
VFATWFSRLYRGETLRAFVRHAAIYEEARQAPAIYTNGISLHHCG